MNARITGGTDAAELGAQLTDPRHLCAALGLLDGYKPGRQAGFVFDQSAPWASVAYSSFSHDPSLPNGWSFRLMLFLDRPIAAAEHAGLWRVVNERLGGVADKQANDVGRVWFKPSCRYDTPEEARLFLVHQGEALNVNELLSEAGATAGARFASVQAPAR